MIQANPNIAPITADLLAEFADAPSEVVERLRKAVPNGLADDSEEEGGLDPKAQQVMQAMQQQLQILEQAFQKVVAELEKSQAQLNNRTADLKTKVYIEEMKIRADLEMAKMKLYDDRKAQQTELRGEVAEGASDKQVSPEAIAELAAFLQATSNRLANLEEMLGQSEGGEEVDESASPEQSGTGEGEMEAPEPSPVGLTEE
jgi:hypothetical protein